MGKTTTAAAESWSHRPHLLKNTTSLQKNPLEWRLEWSESINRNKQLDFWSWYSSPCLCWEATKRRLNAIFITSLSSAALFNEHLPHKGSLFSSGYMMANFTVMSDVRRRIRIICIIRKWRAENWELGFRECEDEKEILREYLMTITLCRAEKLNFKHSWHDTKRINRLFLKKKKNRSQAWSWAKWAWPPWQWGGAYTAVNHVCFWLQFKVSVSVWLLRSFVTERFS